MNTTLFQNIFESSIEGILVVDEKGIIIKANVAVHEIFGYGPGELLNENIKTLIPKKYRESQKEYRKNYTKNPQSRHSEKVNNLLGLKKDGTEFYLDISLSPTQIDDKKIIIAFIKDISEKKEANKALLESERRLSAVIGNLPGFIYRCKNDQNFTAEFGSKGIYKITGYKISHFLEGKIHFGQTILDKDKEYAWNTIQKAIKEKEKYNLQFRTLTKTGEIKYLWGQGEGVFDNNDKVVALEGFIQDITDNVLLKKIVKRKEAKNKAFLEAVPDLMFIMDSKGNFLDFHAPEPEKLTISADKIVGKNIKEALPPKVYQKMNGALRDTFLNKRNNTINYSLKINKTNYYFEARVVPLNNNSILTIVRDVTDKRYTENTLQIKNRALGAAGNGILIADAQKPDYPIIYSNAAFSEITGYRQSEVLGKNCRFLQFDDRDQEAVRTIKNALNEGTPCEVELRNYKKDGTLFYNNLTITPIYDDEQKLTHFIGVQNDVTKRKVEEIRKEQMQNILEMIAQEQPLRFVIHHLIEVLENNIKDTLASVLLISKEQNTIHQFIGPNLPRVLKDKIEGTKLNATFCPCTSAAYNKKEIIIADLTNNINWKDNKILDLQLGLESSWSFPIFSSNQEILGVFTLYSKKSKTPLPEEKDLIYNIVNLLSIAIEQEIIKEELYQSRKKLATYAQNLETTVKERTDDLKVTLQKLVETNINLEDQITETRLAESKALDNQALFSAIAKNFPNGAIAVVDDKYKLIFIDGNELSDFGISGSYYENMSIDNIDMLNNDQKMFIKDSIKKTLSGKHLSLELKYRGQTYAVNTTPFYDHNKKINRALFVYHNISEHKQVELNILNALRKEQELNELKSNFVSMASHEFRTPLSTILSSATLIEKQNETGKEDKRLNYVSRIKSNVKNLVNILNDFLSLSRLEDGKLSLEPETFDLINFSKNIIEEIGLSKKDGQTIDLNYDKDVLEVHQDPKTIRLIINNLLSNAIKYSSENKHIAISITSDKELVYLQFTDQGMGIPIEDRDQLFNRFFRSKNADHIQGTGLGLYIVRQYIGLMGGTINLRDNDNEGITFLVEFPLTAHAKQLLVERII